MENQELPVRLDDLINDVNASAPEGEALPQLDAACRLAVRLDEMSDHLIGHFVDQARLAGASWSDIGGQIGVSKQAAQQRFAGDNIIDLAAEFGPNTRFTARVKVVLEKAQLSACHTGNDHVGSLHLLLGLLEEPRSVACEALQAMGVSLSALSRDVAAALPAANPEPIDPADGVPPLSKDGRKALQLSVRFALRQGHNYIGTEHLLLGVLTTSDSPSVDVLTAHGVSRKSAVTQVLKLATERGTRYAAA